MICIVMCMTADDSWLGCLLKILSCQLVTAVLIDGSIHTVQ